MEPVTHRRIDALLTRYAQSHQHPMNEFIHCICVPAIVFSLLGLCWVVSPVAAMIVVAASLLYYFSLSLVFAVGMLIMAGAMLLVLAWLPSAVILPISAAVFVAAWIGQFIGHRIEGKKPSFFEDVRFLLIGPLFVLGVWFRRWHLHY